MVMCISPLKDVGLINFLLPPILSYFLIKVYQIYTTFFV